MSGWYRIGVVLSVLWFICFGLWLRFYTSNSAGERLGREFSFCSTTWERERDRFLNEYADKWDRAAIDNHLAKLNQNEKECSDRASASLYREWIPNWAIALIAAISVGLWWLVGLIVVSVGRWVAAGFRRANP
jgi:hypothetical protein